MWTHKDEAENFRSTLNGAAVTVCSYMNFSFDTLTEMDHHGYGFTVLCFVTKHLSCWDKLVLYTAIIH